MAQFAGIIFWINDASVLHVLGQNLLFLSKGVVENILCNWTSLWALDVKVSL